jgi:hypothetical protein
LKLTVKVRDKIVADGLNDETLMWPTLSAFESEGIQRLR